MFLSLIIMNYLLFVSCLFAVCLAATYGQFFPTSTGRPTHHHTASTHRHTATTHRTTGTTPTSALSCVCSCCSGFRCQPVFLRSFGDATCVTEACKDKCKVFEPEYCDHAVLGVNDAYCAMLG
ncbi:unnamed protein product [Rotaria sordida]|uniref:Uncharacterized protein n=2 Tax=Rotaria sordida TaxID=392033 RepID=A0A814RKH9_9BILA|nr:unnamed protein product [Rotaria sordida]